MSAALLSNFSHLNVHQANNAIRLAAGVRVLVRRADFYFNGTPVHLRVLSLRRLHLAEKSSWRNRRSKSSRVPSREKNSCRIVAWWPAATWAVESVCRQSTKRHLSVHDAFALIDETADRDFLGNHRRSAHVVVFEVAHQ